jgi:hypothetical protein
MHDEYLQVLVVAGLGRQGREGDPDLALVSDPGLAVTFPEASVIFRGSQTVWGFPSTRDGTVEGRTA